MPGPRISITSGSPDHQQTAAIAAAIERFAAETAPDQTAEPQPSGWQRAHLLENVGAMPRGLYLWGEPRGWGTLRR